VNDSSTTIVWEISARTGWKPRQEISEATPPVPASIQRLQIFAFSIIYFMPRRPNLVP
jgi:hypothetical protein